MEVKEESFRALEDILEDRDRQIKILECELFNSREEIDNLRCVLSEMKNKEDDDIEIITKIQKTLENERSLNEARCVKIYKAFKKKDQRIAELENFMVHESKPPLLKTRENNPAYETKLAVIEENVIEMFKSLCNLTNRIDSESPIKVTKKLSLESVFLNFPKVYSKLFSITNSVVKKLESQSQREDLQAKLNFLEKRNNQMEDELCSCLANLKMEETRFKDLENEKIALNKAYKGAIEELDKVHFEFASNFALSKEEKALFEKQLSDLELLLSQKNNQLKIWEEKGKEFETRIDEMEIWRKKFFALSEDSKSKFKEFSAKEKELFQEIEKLKSQKKLSNKQKIIFEKIVNEGTLASFSKENVSILENEISDQLDKQEFDLIKNLHSHCQKLQNEIRNKETKIRETENLMNQKENLISEYRDKIESLNDEISKILQEKEVSRLTIKNLETQIENFLQEEKSDKLKSELLDLKLAFNNIKVEREKFSDLILKNDTLEAQLHSANSKLENSICKTRKLEAEICKMRIFEEKCFDQESSIRNLEQTCANFTKTLEELNSKKLEIKTLNAKLETCANTLKMKDSLLIKLEEKSKSNEEKAFQFSNFEEAKNLQIENLSKALKYSENVLKIFRERFSKFINGINQGKPLEKFCENVYEISQKEALIIQLKKKLSTKKKGETDSSLSKKNVSQDLKVLESQYLAVKTQLEYEIESNSELKRNEEAKAQALIELKGELQSSQNEIKSLKNELFILKGLHQKEIQKFIEQIDSFKSDILKENSISDAKQELKEAQRLLKNSREELNSKKSKVKELKMLVDNKEKAIQTLSENLRVLKEKERFMMAKAEVSNPRDGIKQSELDSLSKEVKELNEKVKRLKGELVRKEKMLSETKAKCEAFEAQLSTLSETQKNFEVVKDALKKAKSESDRKEEMLKAMKLKLSNVLQEEKSLKETLQELGQEKEDSNSKENMRLNMLKTNFQKNEKFLAILVDVLTVIYRDCLLNSADSRKQRLDSTSKNIQRYSDSMKILNMTEEEMKDFLFADANAIPKDAISHFERLLDKRERVDKDELKAILWKAIESVSISK